MEWTKEIVDGLQVMFMAMLPVIELRGAIPLGIAKGFSHMGALFWAYTGSMIPVPFILILIRPITNWLRQTSLFRSLVERIENKTLKKGSGTVKKYGLLGLLIFVAIPLPGTGVWSGSLLASLLNYRFKYAFPAVAIGNLIAGFLILVLSYGVLHIIS